MCFSLKHTASGLQREVDIDRSVIDAALAQQIIDKGRVVGVLTTGRITALAKKLFDEANIAWAENIPENHFMSVDGLEVW